MATKRKFKNIKKKETYMQKLQPIFKLGLDVVFTEKDSNLLATGWCKGLRSIYLSRRLYRRNQIKAAFPKGCLVIWENCLVEDKTPYFLEFDEDFAACIDINYAFLNNYKVHCYGCLQEYELACSANDIIMCDHCLESIFITPKLNLIQKTSNMAEFNSKGAYSKAILWAIELIDYYTDYRYTGPRNNFFPNLA